MGDYSPSERDDGDAEIQRMNSSELQEKAKEFQESVSQKKENGDMKQSPNSKGGVLLVDGMNFGGGKSHGHHHKKKGAFAGVFVPTCENMWGVLIFLRFHVIVGNAGVGQALACVFLSFSCAFCTTSSMSATVSSGGFVSKGGPYYMISRALGPCVGASVGIMYWLAITMLAVLETLGAVEGILMGWPETDFSVISTRLYGTLVFILLAIFVYGGIGVVSKLGIFFVFVVFSTLTVYYVGLGTAPATSAAEANSMVTGLSFETLKNNWGPHYKDGNDFGYVLSVFFPCFTGILSGANRADILQDPPKNLRQGTFGAIIFSLFMYSSFMILWGMVD